NGVAVLAPADGDVAQDPSEAEPTLLALVGMGDDGTAGRVASDPWRPHRLVHRAVAGIHEHAGADVIHGRTRERTALVHAGHRLGGEVLPDVHGVGHRPAAAAALQDPGAGIRLLPGLPVVVID